MQPLEHLNAFTPETLDLMAGRAGFVRCRRPPTFLGTSLVQAARTVAGLLWQPRTTDAFYRRV
ncbi:MAG: hypothetical protein C0524_08970 [Rhodobacter sp.]|nr:hypothetical protein [Rhodobacter sp.]